MSTFTKTNSIINNNVLQLSTKNSTTLIYKTFQSNLYKFETFGEEAGLGISTLNKDNFVLTKHIDNMKLSNHANLNHKTQNHLVTKQKLLCNNLLGSYAPFVKTFIIRGIGYQASVIDNDITNSEFPYSRYLSLRVGHSFLVYKPIPNYIGVKVSKKDRKLVLYGAVKEQVANFAKVIFKLRPPSIYTGRGIRIKKGMHRRKLGKKDVRKGKA